MFVDQSLLVVGVSEEADFPLTVVGGPGVVLLLSLSGTDPFVVAFVLVTMGDVRDTAGALPVATVLCNDSLVIIDGLVVLIKLLVVSIAVLTPLLLVHCKLADSKMISMEISMVSPL